MYVWMGINVEEQISNIKKKAYEIDRLIGFENSCFVMPLHISLKMSFEVLDSEFLNVVETILKYFQTLCAFPIDVKGIENEKTIIWIRMHYNKNLNRIHDDLNELLSKKHNIGLHEYDQDYIFHTTLFMDTDEKKISKAYELIQNEEFSCTLVANNFNIGISTSGKLGTYSIYKSILLKNKMS